MSKFWDVATLAYVVGLVQCGDQAKAEEYRGANVRTKPSKNEMHLMFTHFRTSSVTELHLIISSLSL